MATANKSKPAYFLEPGKSETEYVVYAVDVEDLPRFARYFPKAEAIGQAKGIERGYTRPRHADKLGQRWPGRFHQTDVSKPKAEATEECLLRTLEAIDLAECQAIAKTFDVWGDDDA